MSLLRRLLASDEAPPPRPGPTDDVWYSGELENGGPLSPEFALRVSTVYRAVNLLAGDVAQIPLVLYERLERGKKPSSAPLAEVLDRPNERMTSFEWREHITACLLLRGNAYNRIYSGRRGYVDRLEPLHPAHVTVDLLKSGRRRYVIRAPGESEERLTQDEISHVMAFSLNGVTGVTPIGLARVGISLAQAAEEFGARQFTQRPMISGLLENPGTLDNEASKRMGESFRRAWASRAGWHGVPVLEQGTKWTQVGMSNEDAEFLATRQFQVTDIARWFGVPPHMIGDLTKASFNNIEQQSIDYVVHSLLPWLKRIESRLVADLIVDRRLFTEFLVDGLLRGEAKARADAYAIYLDRGVLTRNEVRELENRNPIEGGDTPTVAANLAGNRPAEKPQGASNA